MEESFEDLLERANYWMSLKIRSRPGEAAGRYRQIQLRWPDRFTPELKKNSFEASYKAAAKAYGGFANHYDSLLNALHAVSLIPDTDPSPDTLQKLYRILSQNWQAFREYDKAIQASHKAEEYSRKLDNPGYLRKILSSRTSILLRSGREEEALHLAERILEECKDSDDRSAAQSLTDILCRHYLESDRDGTRAEAWIFRNLSWGDSRALAYKGWLRIIRGDREGALASFAEYTHRIGTELHVGDIFAYPEKIDGRRPRCFFVDYAELLADTDPVRASILLRRFTDILEKNAADNRDLIVRNLFLADHLPDLLRAFEILSKTDQEAAWSVLQIIKNAYLVLETEFQGEGTFTHKAAGLFRKTLAEAAFADESLLSYSYRHFEAPDRSLESLRSRMKPQDIILDYHQTPTELLCFKVSRDDFRLFRIPADRATTLQTSEHISDAVETAIGSMISLNPAKKTLNHVRESLPQGQFCIPLPSLPTEYRLYVVPCLTLNRMPIHLFHSAPVIYLFNSLLYPSEKKKRREGIAVLHHSGLPNSVREHSFLTETCGAIPVPDRKTLRSILPKTGRIHISGHFVFDRKTSKSYFDFGFWRLGLAELDGMDFEGLEVVLMACESGRLGEYMQEHENFDACRYFLRQGASSVLAASHAITEATALAFTRALYAPGHRGQSLEEDYQSALSKNPSFAAISPFLLRR